MVRLDSSPRRILILAAIITVVAGLHFTVPTHPHALHVVHVVLRKLYFLPPVMAAAWFGLWGACWTTLAVTVLFTAHAFLDWPGNEMEQANQVGELVGYWVAGAVPGWLFDRQRALLVEVANANEHTLVALVDALDLREHSTRLHSQRVRDYTELIAHRLGVPEQDRRQMGFGALLHDVGKIAVPDSILLKPGKLTAQEWVEMRKHPEAAYGILKDLPFLKNAAELVYAHHEKFNGEGYPRGLKGAAIPLGARIFTVADVYDALTSARSYKASLPHTQAVAELARLSGSHFDPAVVAAFMAIPQEALAAVGRRHRDVG